MLTRYRGERYRAAADPGLVAFVEAGEIYALDFDQIVAFYDVFGHSDPTDADRAYLGAVDRYYLLTHILGRPDALHPWLYDRCREVEFNPDRHLDLWAREHYKSTIITFAGIIQEVITDPEITIGIFAHTKDISTKFCAQIKREFDANEDFRQLYADICWLKPDSEAPTWSAVAFTVRRKGNPKEATVEAHGLVSGQPTSRHFLLRVYDDVVTLESVNTPEQVEKTTTSWEMSDNLSSGEGRFWMIGTRYSFGDSYAAIIDRGVVTTRIYPATDNGKVDGRPVFMSQAVWDVKKKAQRTTLNAQMLQNPLSGKARMFQPQWFKPWFVRPGQLNVYIMGDPSHGKRAKNDRTAIAVIGLDATGNKYFLDGANRRMKLSERWDYLKHYQKRWSNMPGVSMVKVGYERYGQQSDLEYFEERMRTEKINFAIEELAWPNEGPGSKGHRVERLQPDVEHDGFYFPGVVHIPTVGDCTWSADIDAGKMVFHALSKPLNIMQAARDRGQGYLVCEALKKRNEDNAIYDLTLSLMDQMLYFPFGSFDDLVDAASRIYDMDAVPALIDSNVPEAVATPD